MQRHQLQSNEFKNQQLETARAVRTQGWLSCRQAEDAGRLRLPHTHTLTHSHLHLDLCDQQYCYRTYAPKIYICVWQS